MLEYINAGLIGYGYAGKTLHAQLLASTPGIQLRTIVSRDAAKVKADWPEMQVVAQSDELLADPSIDLVVIASPNDTHYPLAKAALLAGKHVVIDKPFTLDSREARSLVSLAQEHDLQLSVFHNRRWDADFLTLQQLLHSGELGEVYHLESHFDRFRPEVRDRWREQAVPGSGLWYDLGAHLLDQTLQLFGQPETLWLDLAQQRPGAKTDDFFHAVLQYGARRVILHASTQVAAPGARFTVHGSLGSYRKQGLDVQEEQLKSGTSPLDPQFGCDPRPGLLTTVTAQGPREQSIANLTGNYRAFYLQMVEAIQRGTPVPVKPDEVVGVMELIELGLRSAREGRRLPVGAQHLDSVVQQAPSSGPTHTAPLAMPLGQSGSTPRSTPRHPDTPVTRPQPSHPLATRPLSSAANAPTRPSPLPQGTAPMSQKPTPLSSPSSRESSARPTVAPANRPTPSNFRHPTPLDRLQLQEARPPHEKSQSQREPTISLPPRTTTPSSQPFSPAPTTSRFEPARPRPFATLTTQELSSEPRRSPSVHFSATEEPQPSRQGSEPAPILPTSLPTISDADERREPRFTAPPPVAEPPLVPGLRSPGLYVDEPRTPSKLRPVQLPPLRIDPTGDPDEDDLPPFSAS